MIATVRVTGERVDVYPDKLASTEQIDDKHYIKHWTWGEFNTNRKFDETQLFIPGSIILFRYDKQFSAGRPRKN